MRNLRGFLSAASVLLGLAFSTAPPGLAQAGPAESRFLEAAAWGHRAQIEMGRLAQRAAASAQVREFGGRMVAEHSASLAELQPIAARLNVTLPPGVSPARQTALDRLAQLSGAEFDVAYMTETLREHRNDVRTYREAGRAVRDPELAAYIERTLTMLLRHLRTAREISDALGLG
ncbi:MAG: DUF4142 domain-containing protein [Bryobacteraceae bacterium]